MLSLGPHGLPEDYFDPVGTAVRRRIAEMERAILSARTPQQLHEALSRWVAASGGSAYVLTPQGIGLVCLLRFLEWVRSSLGIQ